MATQRVNFLQRNTTGAPLTGATITTTSLYDDGSAGPVIGNAVELDAINQPGFYYFDVNVASGKRLTVVADAGAGVTGEYRYTPFVIDQFAATPSGTAEAVWDEPTNLHMLAGSFGLALGVTLQSSIAALPASSADAVWDEATAAHVGAGSFGLALGTTLQSSIAALPTAATNANAVWDEATASHVGAGSFGLALGTTIQTSIASLPAATDNADAVWNESTATHVVGGSFGRALGVEIPASIAAVPDATEIENAVWDATLASHSVPGSTGEALATAAAGGTPADIASAVWGALVASNQVSGSFGEAATIMQALMHRNWRLTGTTYSGSPPRLTAATMVLYPSKADAVAETGALLSLAFTATYDSAGNMTTALQTDV